jgi:hypothetical protein
MLVWFALDHSGLNASRKVELQDLTVSETHDWEAVSTTSKPPYAISGGCCNANSFLNLIAPPVRVDKISVPSGHTLKSEYDCAFRCGISGVGAGAGVGGGDRN